MLVPLVLMARLESKAQPELGAPLASKAQLVLVPPVTKGRQVQLGQKEQQESKAEPESVRQGRKAILDLLALPEIREQLDQQAPMAQLVSKAH